MQIVRVKYIDDNMAKDKRLQLQHIGGNKKSTWIDLRVSRMEVNGEEIDFTKELGEYEKGDIVKVHFGFAMELPRHKEAMVLPRSSLFKKYGLLLVNSEGVIDESYCGDKDEWFGIFYALKSGEINQYERVAQFRIQDKMEETLFVSVKILGNENRGGEGSTGVK